MADIQTIGDRIGLPNHMIILLLDRDNPKDYEDAYTVLVNPTSYGVTHKACYAKDQPIRATGTTYQFNKVKPESMNIELLFDSTGSLGKIPIIGNLSVLDQINQFMAVAFIANEEETDEKDLKLLRMIWGPMEFVGLLEDISITYSDFDAFGEPIRARAKCTFSGGSIRVGDKPKIKLKKNGLPKKVVNFTKHTHAINGVLKYGSYVGVLSLQPKEGLPKSLRLAGEVAKMIF